MSRKHSTTGYYGEIRKVVERMTELADWMEKHRPEVSVLTLWRADLELICGHPETAAKLQITVPAVGPPKWRKFSLMTTAAEGEQASG